MRNKWSLDSFIKTDIHQSLEDENNPKFKKINYYSLPQQYEKTIGEFLKKYLYEEKEIERLVIRLLIIHVSNITQ